jgi:hypothetical protein
VTAAEDQIGQQLQYQQQTQQLMQYDPPRPDQLFPKFVQDQAYAQVRQHPHQQVPFHAYQEAYLAEAYNEAQLCQDAFNADFYQRVHLPEAHPPQVYQEPHYLDNYQEMMVHTNSYQEPHAMAYPEAHQPRSYRASAYPECASYQQVVLLDGPPQNPDLPPHLLASPIPYELIPTDPDQA